MKDLWARLRGLDPLVVDGLFALAVLVPSLISLTVEPTATNPTPVDGLAVVLTVVGVGAIALRRRHPLVTLWVSIGAAIVYTARDYVESGNAVAVIVALYTAAHLTPRRRWLWGAAAIVAFLVGMNLLRPEDLSGANLVGNLAIFGIAAAFGDSNATRRANALALEQRATTLERNQAIEAERAVTEERLRIARQLHDVVAHALAVIAVQSGVGGHVIDTDPDEAKRVLDRINDASRETLDEMRRMLGVLRGDDGERAGLEPAPGLQDVDQLVQGVRDAGIDVTVETVCACSGEACSVGACECSAVPAGVGLTAYRIVQEALTNVLKHAGPAEAEVRIDCDPGRIRIEVTDDGRGAAAEAGSGTRLGLIGMRERVALFDGELDIGPRPGGGWRVCATLPYERVNA